MMVRRGLDTMLIGLAAFSLSVPAAAQFSERHKFFEAIRKGDITAVRSIIEQPGSSMIDMRNADTGGMALHMVTERRDAPWMNYLLSSGADVNARDTSGNTALLIASGLGYVDGVRLLLARGAAVDIANDSGETPLIRAVQRRDMASTQLLLKAGADPDATDHVAGLSARDYATRDPRARRILELIETEQTEKAELIGPTR